MKKVAQKSNALIAQEAILLVAQKTVRLVAYGIGDLMPPLPTDYYFVVDYQGKYVVDHEENYVIAKSE